MSSWTGSPGSVFFFIPSIQAANTSENTKYEVVEANVTHDGTNAFISTFGSTTNAEPDGSSTTTMMPTWAADIDSGNVRVLVTNPTADSMVFKFQRIAIDA